MLSEGEFASDIDAKIFGMLGPVYGLVVDCKCRYACCVSSSEKNTYSFERVNFNAPPVKPGCCDVELVLKFSCYTFRVFVYGKEH
jgi:hypothetical protein